VDGAKTITYTLNEFSVSFMKEDESNGILFDIVDFCIWSEQWIIREEL
jgi:hypothetical protein